MSDIPDELAILLREVSDETERERLVHAYHHIAGGDPNSLPVQFALFTRGIALALMKAVGTHAAALERNSHTVEQGQRQLDAIHAAAAKIEAAAGRAEQVRFKNLLFALGLAFLAGIVVAGLFAAWIHH